MKSHIPPLRSVRNPSGPTLCYSENSGVKIIEQDGLYFKDLSGDGALTPYEDWRLSATERAKDLAARLSIEQIAGLMLYSIHQSIPGLDNPYFGKTTYGGKPLAESGMPLYALSDQQRAFIGDNYLRHVLLMFTKSARDAALWNNNLQELAESLPFGVPINTSSDPRHGTLVTFEFNAGAGGDISHWPEPLGLAATFNPALVKQFGEIASLEYRAMGIATALSPQIDLCTEPRWSRFGGSFGESSRLSADLARAYCDGFQTSHGDAEIKGGWGYESVNAMVKHWPGGGAVESGRDAHFGCGKYSVYPGGNFDDHLIPFTEGAFQLDGDTKKASAVMPYYTIVVGQDRLNGENVGSSYSEYLINELLRKKYAYDEVVCTDWSITNDEGPLDSMFSGKCWGVETLTQEERCYKIIMAGVDQFGGLNEKAPVLAAYELGVREHGEAFMRARFEASATRLLRNIFRTGLFENPYLNADETEKTVGKPAYMQAGFDAQVQSIVLLKNAKNALPMAPMKKVYVPKQYLPKFTDFMGMPHEEGWQSPIPAELLQKYFMPTENPEEADFALCCIRRPDISGALLGGYSREDLANGGNGYVPISLQYRPYTAEYARAQSLAGGDPQEAFTNRSYKGKTVHVNNECDLDMVLETRQKMGNKPVIVCVETDRPMVVAEFEGAADAILMMFGQQPQALLELIAGKAEPSALLPLQLPADMRTIEEQMEDVPFDMECYVDADGHRYDFGFGLNWGGVICDARTAKYAHQKP